MNTDLERIGPYQILNELGQGGMAKVFKAIQPSVNRVVALKVLPASLERDEVAVKRFAQEAETAANLEHPNIVRVWEASIHQSPYYIAMQFLDGGTLADKLEHGPLSIEQALTITEAICRALDHAHERGVVHRDIKPANIMFGRNGAAVLTDFGIARAADRTKLTTDGSTFGTPDYMSPEQAKGRPLDHRSDLYSAAVVLYEMLTGRPPFTGDQPLAVLNQVVNEPVPSLASLGVSVPPSADRFFARALAKDPDNRFQNGAELTKALREAMAGRPPNEVKDRPKRQSNKVLTVMLTIALLGIVVTSIIILSGGSNRSNGGSGTGVYPTSTVKLSSVTFDPKQVPSSGSVVSLTCLDVKLARTGQVKVELRVASGAPLVSKLLATDGRKVQGMVFIPANAEQPSRVLTVALRDSTGKQWTAAPIGQDGNPRLGLAEQLATKSAAMINQITAEIKRLVKNPPPASQVASIRQELRRRCASAKKLAEDAVNIAPGCRDAYVCRIEACVLSEDTVEAKDLAQDAVRRFPADHKMRELLDAVKQR